jgi:hypothetical protein
MDHVIICLGHVILCVCWQTHFAFALLLPFFMPKKTWASEDQQTWLLAQLADFRQAQEAKTTPGYFIELFQNFHEMWPLAPPNADEISKADGNDEKAKTLKQKASEVVSVPYTPIVDCGLYFF